MIENLIIKLREDFKYRDIWLEKTNHPNEFRIIMNRRMLFECEASAVTIDGTLCIQMEEDRYEAIKNRIAKHIEENILLELYEHKIFSFRGFRDLIENHNLDQEFGMQLAYFLGKHEDRWIKYFQDYTLWWYNDIQPLSGTAGILVVKDNKPVDYVVIWRS